MVRTANCIFGLFLVVLLGCSQAAGPSAMQGSVATFNKVAPVRAFNAAQKALKQHFQIDSINRQSLVIRSCPIEYVSSESTGTLSEALAPSKHTFRKIATVRVRKSQKTGSAIVVRVEVQKRDTTAMHAFAYQRQSEDRPSYTPAEKTSTHGDKKAEVWSTVRRDYNQERQILAAIKEIVGK